MFFCEFVLHVCPASLFWIVASDGLLRAYVLEGSFGCFVWKVRLDVSSGSVVWEIRLDVLCVRFGW